MRIFATPLFLILAFHACNAADFSPATITVSLDASVSKFKPSHAFGAAIDGHQQGDEERMLSPNNVAQMLQAGLNPLSYRLRTELAVEAWHWNPHGTWSDTRHRQGYWTSNAWSKEPIRVCYGYRLPRRGDTLDEANNDGYSMLDDGNLSTFWKSNPYLTRPFTGEKDSLHPQWAVFDLGKPEEINAIKINWGIPFAIRFSIQYANSDNVYFGTNLPGVWREFPNGKIRQGGGGDTLLRLAEKPIKTRYIRVWMTESSNTAPNGSVDIRDQLGYAIREIAIGIEGKDGIFHDRICHAPDKNQTLVYVSSTDPWHTEKDRDPKVEQPGFDLIAKSGLMNGLPMMVPVPVFYDTPENAAAEIAFLKSRKYPFTQVEMGEEPDGQRISPVDFAALYVQFADAIHKVAPGIQLGGPSLLTIDWEKGAFNYRFDHRWWMRDFLSYLRRKHHADDFKFLTFEWYPFDDFGEAPAVQIVRNPEMLERSMKLIRQSGVPRDIPIGITEFGYSVFSGRPEVDIAGALLNADIVGSFLNLKGDSTYLYGYEPDTLANETGASWGGLMMLLSRRDGKIRARLPTWYAARMITKEWAQPGDGEHTVYTAKSSAKNAKGESLITAYALKRPDNRWSFLLINKAPSTNYEITFRFTRHGRVVTSPLTGPFDIWQYSSRQYLWHDNGAHGFPVRNALPSHRSVATGRDGVFHLPPWSLTVIRSAAEP